MFLRTGLARTFVAIATAVMLGAAACTPAATPAPTTAPAAPKPTTAPAPAAPAATTAPAAKPAATTAPAAAKPAATTAPAAAKPAATTAPAAAKPTGPLKKVTITYGFLSPTVLAFVVAKEKGFWEKYGLDVDPIRTENAPAAVQAMIGGSSLAAYSSAVEWIGAVATGAPVKVLMGIQPRSLDSLVALPKIKDPSQLKGARLAVSQLGALSHLTSFLMVEQLGLDPDKDVSYVSIGNDAARAAAVQAGAVDAAVVNPTSGNKLVNELGYTVLVAGDKAGISFPSVNMGVTQRTLETERETLKGLIKGIADAIDYFYLPENEMEMKQLLARELKMDVTESTIDVGYNQYFDGKQFANPPIIEREGFQKVKDFSSKFNPAVANVDVNSIIDDSVLRDALAERQSAR